MEQLRLKIFVDLIPEMGDVDVDDIGRRIEVIVPHLLGNHRAGDDLPRVPHEEFKEGIFFGGELDFYFFPENTMPVGF
jgi:hypothetical protein